MKKYLIRTEARLFNYFTKAPEQFDYTFTVNSLQDIQNEILKNIMDYARNFCYENLDFESEINRPDFYIHHLRANRIPGTPFFTIYAKFGLSEKDEKIFDHIMFTINDIIMIADKGSNKND